MNNWFMIDSTLMVNLLLLPLRRQASMSAQTMLVATAGKHAALLVTWRRVGYTPTMWEEYSGRRVAVLHSMTCPLRQSLSHRWLYPATGDCDHRLIGVLQSVLVGRIQSFVWLPGRYCIGLLRHIVAHSELRRPRRTCLQAALEPQCDWLIPLAGLSPIALLSDIPLAAFAASRRRSTASLLTGAAAHLSAAR